MAGMLFFSLAILSCPAPLSLIFAVIIHECGHLFFGALLGLGRPAVTLTGAGISLSYPKEKKLFSSLALFLGGPVIGGLFSLPGFLPESFRAYSLGLSLLNLLPAAGLDGGAILREILYRSFPPATAYIILRATGSAAVLSLFCLCTAVQLKAGANLTLLAVTSYLTVSVLCEK